MKRGANPKAVVIKFIPHTRHRYNTTGDYFIDKQGNWQIRVSKMSDVDSQIAVALHELFEMGAVVSKAVRTNQSPVAAIKKIDEFDMMYEKEREQGKHAPDSEPGYDRRSPYWSEHFNAEQIERHYVTHVGMMWSTHEENMPA